MFVSEGVRSVCVCARVCVHPACVGSNPRTSHQSGCVRRDHHHPERQVEPRGGPRPELQDHLRPQRWGPEPDGRATPPVDTYCILHLKENIRQYDSWIVCTCCSTKNGHWDIMTFLRGGWYYCATNFLYTIYCQIRDYKFIIGVGKFGTVLTLCS